MSIGDRLLDHVWIVNRTDEVDGLYVFEDEHRARNYASRYVDASISEEVVMNDSIAAQFLIDTADDDLDIEPYDHSAAKEDRRNGLQVELHDHSAAKEDRRNRRQPGRSVPPTGTREDALVRACEMAAAIECYKEHDEDFSSDCMHCMARAALASDDAAGQARTEGVPRRSADEGALDEIAHILRHPEWGVGMLEDIADIITQTGRDIAGTGEPTWLRH